MNSTIRLLQLLGLAGVLVVTSAAGCHRGTSTKDGPNSHVQKSLASAQSVPETLKSSSARTPSEPSNSHALMHDPLHPPIDCPLRKQGIDPAHMRPFEAVEKYIAFLDRADRAVWQKPDAVVGAIGLRGTETVMDLGAGSGYFSFRFAKSLPKGHVIAADVEPEMVRHIHHKAMMDHIPNVEAKLIQPSDPGVPKGVDLVFICDVLHHVSDRPTWLSKIASALRPGAKLVLIEFKEGKLPKGPPASLKIPRAKLVSLVTKAGFVLAGEKPTLLPYQTFLVFRKP